MRTINLNGYIDEEVWYGDEITPTMLHDALYGENDEFSDDVRIILNSYGGSCNAAVRMHDDIRAYPGKVHLVISGTAASAATVLSEAADTLEMTPGSLYMIHDPSTVAWGNERDFNEAIALLKACKESILNIYSRRSPEVRNALQVGTLSEGGYTVPDEFEHQLIQGLEDENIMRGLVHKITTSSGDRKIPLVTARGSASWIEEEATIPESNDTFGQVTLGAHKVGCMIRVSEELLHDSAFDLAAYIAGEFARRVGAAE